MTDWQTLGALDVVDDAEFVRLGATARAFDCTNDEREKALAHRHQKELAGAAPEVSLRPIVRAYAALRAVLDTPPERFVREGPPTVSEDDLPRRAIGAAVARVVERVTWCNVRVDSVTFGDQRYNVLFRMSHDECRQDLTCEVEPLELLARLTKAAPVGAPPVGGPPLTISMRAVPLLQTGAVRAMVAWGKPMSLVTQELCFDLVVEGRRVFGRTLDVRVESPPHIGGVSEDIVVTMQDGAVKPEVMNPVYVVGDARRLLDGLRNLPTLAGAPTTTQHARDHAAHMAALLATGAAVSVTLR